MKWKVLCAALAASTCLWLAPVSGESDPVSIRCGNEGPSRLFPKEPITLATGMTKEAAIAAADDDAWIEQALADYYRWLYDDRCSVCEDSNGQPKPFGPPCTSLFTIDPVEGDDVGVEIEIIEDEATGTFSVVVTFDGEVAGSIYCFKTC